MPPSATQSLRGIGRYINLPTAASACWEDKLLLSHSEMPNLFGPPTPAGQPRQSEDYAFTEIITFDFSHPVILEDEATPAGQLWQKTVQLYISHGDAKTLWWGRRVESPQVVKLMIGECNSGELPFHSRGN